MSYRLESADASVERGARRIALEQIDKALGEIADGSIDLEQTAHQIRKRCKKLRALLRLIRPCFKAYGAENAGFRDIARSISDLRDLTAMAEAYDALMERYEDQVDRRAFAPIRRRLTERRKKIAAESGFHDRLATVRDDLVAARDRARKWRLTEDGFPAVEGGLSKTYARGRKRMAAALSEETDEALHEWRKRMTHHMLHARLLREIWPAPISAHRDEAKRLSDLLGDHHDYSVLKASLRAAPDAFAGPKDLRVFRSLIDRRQSELAEEAAVLGEKLLAEKPKRLRKRWRAYWEAGAPPASGVRTAA